MRALRSQLLIWPFILAQFLSFEANGRDFFNLTGQRIKNGVLIVSLADGKTLFEENSDALMSPASLTKLLTAAALLDRFGANHTIETPFFYSGRLKNGVIHGDLIIEGKGDPYLVSEHLWQIAADLKNLGIDQIKGDLIIDNSYFDNEFWNGARLSGKKTSRNAYDAPVSAFSINFNAFAIIVAPGPFKGSKAVLALDPYWIRGVEAKNQLSTGSAKSRSTVHIRRNSLKDGRAQIVASGYVPYGSSAKKIYRSVHDPVIFAGETIRSFFAKAGIQLRGQVQSRAMDKSKLKLLYTHSGKSIKDMIAGLGLYSNNFIADSLTKKLGAVDGKGSLENGVVQLKKFLEDKVGFKPGAYQLYGGSGLDTKNRLTARQIVALLQYVYNQGRYFPEFLVSLSTSGETGSLRRRFKNQLNGVVRAKTGSLTQPIAVSSLAGFILEPGKAPLAFAILQNGESGVSQPNIGELHRVQESGLSKILHRF